MEVNLDCLNRLLYKLTLELGRRHLNMEALEKLNRKMKVPSLRPKITELYAR